MRQVRRPGPIPAATPQVLDLTITALNEFGDGVATVGKALLKVARTVPGDRVRVVDTPGRQRWRSARLVKIVTPSSARLEAGCAAFDAGCGGCQWRSLPISSQLDWKQRLVKEVLGRSLRLPCPVLPCIAADSSAGFRNKLSLQVRDGQFWFMQEFNDQAQRPADCPVASPVNRALWQALREMQAPAGLDQVHIRSTSSQQAGIALFARQSSQALRAFAATLMELPGVTGVGSLVKGSWQVLAGTGELEHQLGDIRWRFPLHGFFQTNYDQAAKLLDLCLAALDLPGPARPGTTARILDLYCGAGFFTLPLARRYQSVHGIELSAPAIATAQANARDNGLADVSFQAGDAGALLAAIPPGTYAAAVLDPPRSGCEPAALTVLLRLAIPRLVYISCSPVSLGRDIAVLTKAGYQIRQVQPLDMFPHTAHVETVVVLDRRSAP